MKRYISFIVCLLVLGLSSTGILPCKETLQALQNEAGFTTIEPITFYFHYGSHFPRLVLKSSEARIWHSFHAADQDSEKKPLFVFYNGGPGSASSSGLMSMCTSRFSLDNRIESGGGETFIPNPFSWTRMGNLLYIDARQAGFSYNLMDQVQDFNSRLKEFNSQNFNPFFDAADFIRVILRFLARHPQLQKNPVVIVGESYGGMRTICMLHILLNYSDYGNAQEMYQDEALVEEIQTHFNTVFPEYQNQIIPPEVITRQFGHQILVQPAISYGYQLYFTDQLLRQPGSLVYQVGQEVGIPYDPNVHGDPLDFLSVVAGRDLYIYTKPRGWLNGFFSNAGRLLRSTQNLMLITGMDVTSIDHLYASARTRAYRIFDTDYALNFSEEDVRPIIKFHFLDPARLEADDVRQEPGDMSAVFGTLRPWDRYFMGTNYHANWAFHVFNVAKVRGYEVDINDPRFGRMFLQNVAHVNTFITNAPLDLVVYPYAIIPTLATYENILESVQHVKHPLNGEERPGHIILKYLPSAFPNIQNLDMRIIRFPLYAISPHAVPLLQPEEILSDVSRWLRERGIDVE